MQPIRIIRGEWYPAWLSRYISSGAENLRKLINEKRHAIKETGSTYRAIAIWSGAGLLHEKREEGQWRKFSIIDLTWLKIIQELRGFGFPLERIKRVKEDLFPQGNSRPIPILDVYALQAFSDVPTYVVIFASGEADLVIWEEYETCREFFPERLAQPHILISLNEIVRSIFPKDLKPLLHGEMGGRIPKPRTGMSARHK